MVRGHSQGEFSTVTDDDRRPAMQRRAVVVGYAQTYDLNSRQSAAEAMPAHDTYATLDATPIDR
jgi:hypothetical protein